MRKFADTQTADLTGIRNTAAGLLFPLNKRKAVFKSVLLIFTEWRKPK